MQSNPIKLKGSTVYTDIPGGYASLVSLASNIRKFRRAADLNQTELGHAVGVGQGAVSKWESGESAPEASDLPKIALVLRVPLDLLLQGVHPQYDAARDLTRHASEYQSDSHRQGESSDPASARVQQKRDSAVRQKLKEEIGTVIHRLTAISAALVEDRAPAGAQARRGRRDRKTG